MSKVDDLGIISEGPIRPTLERLKKDPIKIADCPVISDIPGEFEAPFVVVDLLVGMEERGVITADEHLAGARFRAWFRVAELEQLRAIDLSLPRVDGVGRRQPEISVRAETARREVARAISFLEASGPLAASCVWEVLGLEISLRKWAQTRTRKLTHHNASGILAAALERLARMPWTGPGEKS